MLEYGNPILLDKIARAFPELRMIVAHVGQPWIGETVVLLRKHKQLFADLSARYYRQWQFYNALMLAIEYKVTDQLLFGSDFPMQTTQAALDSFRAVNDWARASRYRGSPKRLSRTLPSTARSICCGRTARTRPRYLAIRRPPVAVGPGPLLAQNSNDQNSLEFDPVEYRMHTAHAASIPFADVVGRGIE